MLEGGYAGGVLVGNALNDNGLSFDGFDWRDAGVSTLSGMVAAATAGTSIIGNVVAGGVIGGASTAASQIIGGRTNSELASLELALGTLSGMAGPVVELGISAAVRAGLGSFGRSVSQRLTQLGVAGTVGVSRGIVSGAGMNGVMNWVQGRFSGAGPGVRCPA